MGNTIESLPKIQVQNISLNFIIVITVNIIKKIIVAGDMSVLLENQIVTEIEPWRNVITLS